VLQELWSELTSFSCFKFPVVVLFECAGAVQCWQHLLLQCGVAVLGTDAIPPTSSSGNE